MTGRADGPPSALESLEGARTILQRPAFFPVRGHAQTEVSIDRRGLDVLAIYRGDMELPNKDAAEVIRGRPEPIWGFFDFDPAGLVMANSVPTVRLERIILPSQAWLRRASNTPRGRQLFDSQFAAFGRSLDHAAHPEVIALWHVMKSLRSGVTQERMLSADAP